MLPTLYIKTANPEDKRIKFILEEFARIQSAEFKIELVNSDDELPENSYSINYTNEVKSDKDLYAYTGEFNSSLEFLDNKLYLYSCTKKHNQFDILINSFWFLSRYEEYLSEITGKFINSNVFAHPRANKETFKYPTVNYLFLQLETHIKMIFPELEFGKGDTAVFELSHDLDYIIKTIQLRLKQTAFNSFNSVRLAGKPGFLQQIGKTFNFLLSNPDYWTFDYWCDTETKYNKKSIFYIYTKTDINSPRLWLLDPAYDVSKNIRLQNKLKDLKEKGWEIGLHGSFDSSIELEKLKKEKEVLSESLGFEISRNRQHWLRFREELTPSFHEQLFTHDSTLAFNDLPGFRSGCASIYRLYNHKEKRASKHFEIPQFLMDSNYYDYGKLNMDELYKYIFSMLAELKTIKNTYVSISWHPHTSTSDYNWHELYEEILVNI